MLTVEGGSGLERSLERLEAAADAADVLGLPTQDVRATIAEARARLGFSSNVYVLALIGGTGVGKSSLLNALAGSTVSPASSRRPTTPVPIAWVPRTARDELAPLLGWLGVGDVVEHDRSGLESVAVLDLPDLDSIVPAHRAEVERLLPKVDAVAWVTDPEKYHDAVLHDEFLTDWLPRLSRQALVLNKSDRLSPPDVDRVRQDMEHDLRRGMNGPEDVTVMAVSAAGGEAGLRAFEAWLADGAASKAVVRDRLAATLAAHARELAMGAGIDPASPAAPFLDPDARRAAVDDVSASVLRTIDLTTFQRQAVAATRAQARRRGTGPIGLLTSAVYRLSGREAVVADPDGFLLRWRDRGPLTAAAETLRNALTGSIRTASPLMRPALAASVDWSRLRPGLEAAVDSAIVRRERTLPSSRIWPVIGLLQTIATGALALSVAWVVLWVLARPPVDSVTLPLLGAVPVPFVALVLALLVGYVLARLLGLHAGWMGRRWAGRLQRDITATVREEIAEHGLAPLDRLEAARHSLWEATRDVLATRDRR